MPTFTEQISVTADDGYWTPGGSTFNNSANPIDLGTGADGTAGAHTGFWHFPAVTIPSGQVVSAATLTLRAFANNPGPQFKVIGEQAANPAAVSSVSDGNSRVRTANSVSWTPASWNAGTDYVSADISVVIQEILNLAGWASGNAIQLFVVLASPDISNAQAVGEDGTHPAGCATITITYGAATPQHNPAAWLFDDS